MTYPNITQTHDDDNVENEASSLLTIATAAPASSFSFGPGGGGGPATQMKNGGPTMRATIGTTCVLLGTLAMMYGRGHTPAAPMPRPLRAEDSRRLCCGVTLEPRPPCTIRVGICIVLRATIF